MDFRKNSPIKGYVGPGFRAALLRGISPYSFDLASLDLTSPQGIGGPVKGAMAGDQGFRADLFRAERPPILLILPQLT